MFGSSDARQSGLRRSDDNPFFQVEQKRFKNLFGGD